MFYSLIAIKFSSLLVRCGESDGTGSLGSFAYRFMQIPNPAIPIRDSSTRFRCRRRRRHRNIVRRATGSFKIWRACKLRKLCK